MRIVLAQKMAILGRSGLCSRLEGKTWTVYILGALDQYTAFSVIRLTFSPTLPFFDNPYAPLQLPYIVRPRSTLSFGATTTPPPPPLFTCVDCRFSNRSVRYSVDIPHAQSSKFGSLLGTTSSAHKGHIPCLFPTSFGG